MINFIQNHPLLILSIALIIALLLVLMIVKVSSSGKNKKSKSDNSTKSKSKETKNDSKEKNQEKKVTQVYKSESKEEDPDEKKRREEKDEKELMEKMAFVKTSKTISKLAKREWIEKVPESEFTTEELIAIDDLIREKEIYNESKKSSHFDKSVRLSNFTKSGDYDSMFLSHLSDKKTQIGSNKHLKIDDDFMEKLYSRTYKTLEKSGIDNSIQDFDSDGDELAEQMGDRREEFAYMIDSSYKDTPNTEIPESEYMDDTINLGSENILIVDSVMHRKNSKK